MAVRACKNCNESLPGEAAFCPACGQSVQEITRPWRTVFGELLSEIFDFDGRMFLSLRLLLTRPGFLSYEYIHGRRAAYTSPVRMYLVVSLVFFFVLPLILPVNSGAVSPSHEFSVDLYSKAMFLLLPLFALLLKIFYRRSYYLAHLVFTAYLFSVMFIGFAAMMSIETAADEHLAFILLQSLFLLYMTGYSVAALRRTYGEGWIRSTLKFLGLLMSFLPFLAIAIELASHVKA